MRFILFHTLILLILLINIFPHVSAQTTPYPVSYDIKTYGTTSENCSIKFTNTNTKIRTDANCELCKCVGDLANIGAREGDLISAEICIYEEDFCQFDKFNLGNEPFSKIYDVAPCQPEYELVFELEILSREDKRIKSQSQDFLDLKEDDYLHLNRVDIINKNNCNLKDWVINLYVIKPNGEKDNPFGIGKVYPPIINKNEKYSIIFSNFVIQRSGDKKVEFSNYSLTSEDSKFNESNIYRGTQQLSQEGVWEIGAWLSRKESSVRFEEYNNWIELWFSDNGNLIEPTFKVSDKSIHNERESQLWQFLFNFSANIVTIILAFVAIIISIYLFNYEMRLRKEEDYEIQKDMLNSIETQLRCIDRDITGHREEFKKTPPIIPSYSVHSLNTDFYITKLKSKIGNKETEVLKECMLLIRNNISTINRLLNLAQDYNVKAGTNPHLNELMNNTYYLDLERLISIVRKDLREILSRELQHLKKKRWFQFTRYNNHN